MIRIDKRIFNVRWKNREERLVFFINVFYVSLAVAFGLHDFIKNYLQLGFFYPGSLRIFMFFLSGLIGLCLIKAEQVYLSSIWACVCPIFILYLFPVIVDVNNVEAYILNSLALVLNTFLPNIFFKPKKNGSLIFILCTSILLSNVLCELYVFINKVDPKSEFGIFYFDHIVILMMMKITAWTFIYIIPLNMVRKNEEFENFILGNNKLLSDSKKLIEFQKSEIESQNEELKRIQEKLRVTNLVLKKVICSRTAQLENKNQRLVEYAYINSHSLRGPVARVRGLIELLEITDDEHHVVQYIQLLKVSIAELDDVIYALAEKLHDDNISESAVVTNE